MSTAFLPHLFEPFSRKIPIKSVTQGTGLGMSIVKHLIDKMDGTVTVESKKKELEPYLRSRSCLKGSREQECKKIEEEDQNVDLSGMRVFLQRTMS